MAFASYANRVQNGAVTPFRKFIEGAESVDVKVSLNQDGSIAVQEIVQKQEEISIAKSHKDIKATIPRSEGRDK